MRFAVTIATLALVFDATSAAANSAVPAQFVGYWAGSPELCGSDSDDLILHISEKHISYWESNGPIRAVVTRGSNEIALIAELSGEGETWLATASFTLSTDGRRLLDSTTVPGQTVVRYRCP